MTVFYETADILICSCSFFVPSVPARMNVPTRYVPLSFFAALAALVLLSSAPAQAQELVFTLRGVSQTTPSVQRTDGTAAALLVSDPDVVVNAENVAVDPVTGQLYWTDSGGAGGFVASESAIRRSEADGSGVVTLLQSEIENPVSLVLDVDEAKMYWADPTNSIIQRANLDGTGIETLVEDLAGPRDLALDIVNDKLYWAESGAEFDDRGIPIGTINRVQRSDLDGANVEEIVTVSSGSSDGVAVDPAGGKVYWKVSFDSSTPDQLRRADLDGSNPEDVLGLDSFTQTFVLDLENERVYSTISPDEIRVVNLDGTGAATFLDTGTNSQPAGIALVPPIVSATQVGRRQYDDGRLRRDGGWHRLQRRHRYGRRPSRALRRASDVDRRHSIRRGREPLPCRDRRRPQSHGRQRHASSVRRGGVRRHHGAGGRDGLHPRLDRNRRLRRAANLRGRR